MIQRYPEIRFACITLLLLARCTLVAVAQTERARFNPFTDHAAMPTSLAWIIQIEHPAVQASSEQAQALAAAISQTDLLAETAKAWSRLSRSLGTSPEQSLAMLGRRAQFIAGTKADGLPWAIVLEIDPAQRHDLLSTLQAFPRTYRHKRPISDLEDGRFLLSVFDRDSRAFVLLAPRSDRSIKPARDPKSALFFQLFDLLARGSPSDAEDQPNPLGAAIREAGDGEVIIAKLGTMFSLSRQGQEATTTAKENNSGGSEPEFFVLRLDRAAGGWAGRLVMSMPEPQDLSHKPPSLSLEKLASALSTISWIAYTPQQDRPNSRWPSEIEAVSNLIPAAEGTTRFVALINPNPSSPESVPAVALVQQIDAAAGPRRVDAAVASLLSKVQRSQSASAHPSTATPDHHGLYPSAARVQTVGSSSFLGPRVQVAWKFSDAADQRRTLALVIAHEPDGPSSAADAYTMVNALLSGSVQSRATSPPVFAGRLRPADLQRLLLGQLSAHAPVLPLLTRIESISWNLLPARVGDQPAARGPISLILTPTRRGELGSQ